MDYTGRADMQQNPNPYPNPNSGVSVLHTVNNAASYSYNFNPDPYQPPSIDPHNALFQPQPQPQPPPQPRPPGVDPPPYVPPPVAVEYAQQPISYEPQQFDAAATAAYYQDPNVSWAAAIPQIRATRYAAGVTTPNPAIWSQRRNIRKKGPKKTKVVQSAWCEVCKIDCNSKDVLDQHKLGKKHQKNLEKLIGTTTTTLPGPIIVAPSPAVVAVPSAVLAPPPAAVDASILLRVSTLTPIDKPIIGPEENPEKSKLSNSQKARKKAAAARTEDLETKRRKVMEGGAAADAVRACSICNVVCNSITVFNYHLAGQKHASMMKKHASMVGVASAM